MSENKSYKLVLYPKSVDYILNDWQKIKSTLENIGFIGDLIGNRNDKQENYFVGENFLSLITFLGCSPDIQIDPEGDSDKFCRIVFSDLQNPVQSPVQSPVQFRFFERDVAASCPKCKGKIKNWSTWLDDWKREQIESSHECLQCNQNNRLFELNWRHNAAFSRYFIDIYNVYPQEAIPGDELMSELKRSTGQEWGYFFCD